MLNFSKWQKIEVELTLSERAELTQTLHVYPAGRILTPNDNDLPQYWSATPEAIERIQIDSRTLIRPTEPVILVKADSICYPQYMQKGNEITKVDDSHPNTALFKQIRRWIRHNISKERRHLSASK